MLIHRVVLVRCGGGVGGVEGTQGGAVCRGVGLGIRGIPAHAGGGGVVRAVHMRDTGWSHGDGAGFHSARVSRTTTFVTGGNQNVATVAQAVFHITSSREKQH